MISKRLAIIGGGNIARCLIGGLLADGYDPQKIWVSDPNELILQELSDIFSVHVSTNNLTAIGESDVVAFAVKPQILQQVAREVSDPIQEKKPLVLTFVTGIFQKDLQRWLGGDIPIIRCISNTPAMVRSAITSLYANQHATPQHKEMAESMLRSVGITLWIENEATLNAISALSSSGPAYFFLLMELIQKAAESFGLSPKDAHLLIVQTAFGSAKLALELNSSFKELRQNITSPNGITECAIDYLWKHDVEKLFLSAIKAAKNRCENLASLLGHDD